MIKGSFGKISCWLTDNITDISHRSPNSFQTDTAISLPVPTIKKTPDLLDEVNHSINILPYAHATGTMQSPPRLPATQAQ